MAEGKRRAASNQTRCWDCKNLKYRSMTEKNPLDNHAEVGCADVQEKDDDVEHVEMVGVEENFKHFLANGAEACNPHGHRENNGHLSGNIRYPCAAPL